MGGVDAHVEVFHIPPGAAGIQLVELGPAAVYALDLLLQLPVGHELHPQQGRGNRPGGAGLLLREGTL